MYSLRGLMLYAPDPLRTSSAQDDVVSGFGGNLSVFGGMASFARLDSRGLSPRGSR